MGRKNSQKGGLGSAAGPDRIKAAIGLKARTIMAKTPIGLRRYMTRKKIQKMTAHLMNNGDLNRCLQSEAAKAEVVAEYRARFPGQAAKLDKLIKEQFDTHIQLAGRSEDVLEAVRLQMAFVWFAFGFYPVEYMLFDFMDGNKELSRMRTFVSNLERWTFRFAANDFTNTLLADKAETYRRFCRFYGRDAVIIDGKGDYDGYLRFVERHPSFVLKPVGSSQGNGVRLVEGVEDPRAFYEKLRASGKVLLEERIEQHETMARFNPSSVNTLRIAIYNTRNGLIAGHGIVRVGKKGAFVDNAVQGGISCTVDVRRGMTCSDGYVTNGERFKVHPDSGVAFNGFELPDWEGALSICRQISSEIPDMKYISYDLAYTKKGWVIVEINSSGGYHFQGGTLKGFREDFEKLVASMDLLTPYGFRRGN